MGKRPASQVLERSVSIDRGSYEPAYIQLVTILRECVASGCLLPGDQLPSQSQLCRRYGVSPMTVRRAVNILADQGVVSAQQGRGTYVKSIGLGAATFDLNGLYGLFSDPAKTTVKLLEARMVCADERTAAHLGLAPASRVIYMRRLLHTEGEPSFLHREYLICDPKRPIVEAEMEVTALHSLFGGRGATLLKRGDVSIQAILLDEEEARLLHSSLPMAAFCLEHLFYDFDDNPISWGWLVGQADRLRLTTQVGLSTTAPRVRS